MDEGSQIPPSQVRIRSQGSNPGLSRNRHSTGSVQLYSGLWTDFPPFESKPVLYPSISPPGYSDTRQIQETSPQPTQISSSSYGGGSLKSPTLDVSGIAPGGRIEELDRDEDEDEGNEKTPLIDSATLVLKPKSSMKRSKSGGVNIRIGLEEEERTPLIRQLSAEQTRIGVLRNNNGPRTQQSVRIDTDDYPSEPNNSSGGFQRQHSYSKPEYNVLVKDNGNGKKLIQTVRCKDYDSVREAERKRPGFDKSSDLECRRKSTIGRPLPKRRHSYVIGADETDDGIGLCGWLLTALSWALVIITMPFSLCVCFKVVQEYERAVIFRLGRLLSGGSKGPGIFFVLPCIESYQKVDLRTITLGVPPQEVLTKDSVTVSVDAVVYYRVSNATVSVANVENAHHSTRLLAQTTLRNILGTKNLHEILSDRESISGSMQAALDEATEPWGIKVERVEIKDVRLPVQLQRAMAAEAEAAREARAKVIAAEGEQKASRALKDASDVMSESSAALQLRYLQTLNSISAEHNSTVIFPLPIDILQKLIRH